jgi:hypothetical protein
MAGFADYQLIELLPGPGAESHRAIRRDGRAATLHVLRGGRTPENEATLARLRALPPEAQGKLLEVGEHEGDVFIATVAPPFLPLAAWLSEQLAPGEHSDEFAKVGTFRIPVRPGAAPPPAPRPVPPQASKPVAADPPKPPEPAPKAAATEPGEFTRMFQRQGAAPETPQQPVGGEGGEFTRMFRAQAAPQPAPAPPAQPAPPSEAPGHAASTPGEFTRMFQAQGGVPAQAGEEPAPVAEAASNESAPGGFTSLFQAPASVRDLPTEVLPAAAPPPAPKSTGDAGLTATRTMEVPAVAFRRPPAPPDPAPPAPPPPQAVAPQPAQTPAADPGEFTRMFQSHTPPRSAPVAPPAPRAEKVDKAGGPGEFTRMFEAPRSVPLPNEQWAAPAPKPAKEAPFLDMFGAQTPIADAPQEAGDQGDFTRFFGKPRAGHAPPAAPPRMPDPPGVASPFPAPSPMAARPPIGQSTPEAGGFTQMISRGSYRADAPPPAAAPGGMSGATGVFSTPPASQEPAVPEGPSEYTRMMARPAAAEQEEGGASPKGGGKAGGGMHMPKMPHMPSVPYIPGVRTPHVPRVPRVPGAYEVSALARAKSPRALIYAIIALAVALMGIVTMIFLRR